MNTVQNYLGGSINYIRQIYLNYASDEPKSVLARDLGVCRDNEQNLQSVFCLVVKLKVVLLKRAEAVYSAFLYFI